LVQSHKIAMSSIVDLPLQISSNQLEDQVN